ncbi:MAG: phosphatidylinositol mannoside acyltransferase [Actinomycetaceae bacterium]|nr:phosphatidylinositol mannoside acyltransferase [Actinomycetaceae bacterium]
MDIVKAFKVATALVTRIPEPVGRGIFNAIGAVVGMGNSAGVRQLRKNLNRIVPLTGFAERRRSARAMIHYMRYYYEAFRLPALTEEQIFARVSTENIERITSILESGSSCSAAIMHSGNWDLAGAWATKELAPIHTIAEKLKPDELAELFLTFRQSLGMTIHHAVKGGGAIRKITQSMQEEVIFAPLLCDRDLSASGVEVTLCGHALRVAPGSAMLAQNTGTPMIPLTIVAENFKDDRERVRRAGSPWGVKLLVGEPIYPTAAPHADRETRRADITAMNQQWMDQISLLMPEYHEHWHMLQKVFVEDLDAQRLARALAAQDKDGEA